MIDVDVMQDRIRDANPIPNVENLDADELAYFVAATRTRRADAMQAPTQHSSETATPPTPPPRWRRVWAFAAAFVLILVVVGATALALRSDDAQVTDEPAPSTTVLETPSVVETSTTLAAAPPPKGILDDTGQWRKGRLTEPWTDSIVDVASLPSGGFVVATRDSERILWSPDGVEWIDADPQRQVTAATPWIDHPLAVISVMGDRVVVLDGNDPGLWVGDLQAGAWESIRFDTADLAGQVEPFAVASNDTEVLVLAEHRPKATSEDDEDLFQSAERGYLVFLVNPQTGEAKRHTLSPTWREDSISEVLSGAVAWVNDRWVVALSEAILVSGDGETWTQVPAEDTFKPTLRVNALTAGPSGVIATTCEGLGGHYVWFSEDGLKWENTKVDAFHVEPAYADALGFVVIPTGVDGSGDQVMVSPHGRTWHGATVAGLAAFGPENLAVSGLTVFGHEGENAFLLKYE